MTHPHDHGVERPGVTLRTWRTHGNGRCRLGMRGPATCLGSSPLLTASAARKTQAKVKAEWPRGACTWKGGLSARPFSGEVRDSAAPGLGRLPHSHRAGSASPRGARKPGREWKTAAHPLPGRRSAEPVQEAVLRPSATGRAPSRAAGPAGRPPRLLQLSPATSRPKLQHWRSAEKPRNTAVHGLQKVPAEVSVSG